MTTRYGMFHQYAPAGATVAARHRPAQGRSALTDLESQLLRMLCGPNRSRKRDSSRRGRNLRGNALAKTNWEAHLPPPPHTSVLASWELGMNTVWLSAD